MSKETIMKKENNKTFPIILTAVIILLALGAGAFLLFKDTVPPTIAISPDTINVGKGTQLTVTIEDSGSGLKSIEIVGIQDGKTIPLIKKDLPGGVTKVEEVIDLAK